MQRLQPGERRTVVVVWSTDDASKADDPGFWWGDNAPALPNGRKLAGPRGQSLASLRAEAINGEVTLRVPVAARPDADVPTRRLPVHQWDALPGETTYVIIGHEYRPTHEEVAADRERRAGRSPFPPEVEPLRLEWVAALDAGDGERARELKKQLDDKLAGRGWSKPPFATERSVDEVEVAPGVFVVNDLPPT